MRLIFCVVVVLSTSNLQAQGEEVIAYGQVVTGQINDETPRVVYAFEALRCDFLSLRLTATGGNLDPILTVLDGTGTPILTQDDSAGTPNVAYEPLAIPQSGRYFVVVGRFGYGLGTTSGSYELLIERIGVGAAHGCALRYGDTITSSIDNLESRLIYQFRASSGDILDVQMETISGTLDPYLTVVDSEGVVLSSNDDVLGSGTDALIQALLIPADGTYYIIATRYGEEAGDTSGNFILRLEEAINSGLGNSAVAAQPLRVNTSIDGTLEDNRFEQFYRFEARQNDIISITMERLSDNLDTYIVLATADLREIAFDDDGGEGQNSRLAEFLIPADGTYYIIATRYEREEGNTTGRYRLTLTDEGNAFDAVPLEVRRINYGVSVTGSIDEVTPQVLYAFYAEEGDVITSSMNSTAGDLDPFLNLLADDRTTLLASDDDSAGNQNARIERYEIPATGVYYLQATRYAGEDNPDTAGNYTLVLALRADE